MIDRDAILSQQKWSIDTFGPGYRVQGVTDHIRKELKEIERDPQDLEEWADVIILALDGAQRLCYEQGLDVQAVLDMVDYKQAKNRTRNWPDWRTSDPNKAIEHTR